MIDTKAVTIKEAWCVLGIMAEDGCQFVIGERKGQSMGWQASFPGGLTMTCPHGYTLRVVAEEPIRLGAKA